MTQSFLFQFCPFFWSTGCKVNRNHNSWLLIWIGNLNIETQEFMYFMFSAFCGPISFLKQKHWMLSCLNKKKKKKTFIGRKKLKIYREIQIKNMLSYHYSPHHSIGLYVPPFKKYYFLFKLISPFIFFMVSSFAVFQGINNLAYRKQYEILLENTRAHYIICLTFSP